MNEKIKKNETCCFTGHRKIAKADKQLITEKTKAAILSLIERGVKYFGAGGALGFDTLAAQSVLDLKSEYPDIKLILVLPCDNQTKGWPESDIRMYEYIKQQADKVVYTAHEYYDGCMLDRNRHLVDNSGYCISYLKQKRGGTAYTVNYAQKQGLTIINIADEADE